jgi:hypothetical protein
MKKWFIVLFYLTFLVCFLFVVSSCTKAPVEKKLYSIDIKEHLKALYPDVVWGMTTSSTTEESGKYTSIVFNIEGPKGFLTKHPDAKEVLKQSIIKQNPEVKDIPMIFNFDFPDSVVVGKDQGKQ